jgi:hypothetical protein
LASLLEGDVSGGVHGASQVVVERKVQAEVVGEGGVVQGVEGWRADEVLEEGQCLEELHGDELQVAMC